jgi:hypothetical protein
MLPHRSHSRHDRRLPSPVLVPAVRRKNITATFDGGRITSDAGVMLLGQAERRLGVADKFTAAIADPRNPLLMVRTASPQRHHSAKVQTKRRML